jgi:pimeloyl-ACP methyl ester carboxylesterase
MKSTAKLLLFISATLIMSCGEVKQNTAETKSETTATVSVNNNGVFINHKSYGEGDFTLLFVHGWCINQTYWSKQVEALSPNYRIVTIDLPGFGASGTNRENWSIETYGSDINAVIEQLKLTNVILIGHSMGGDIILEAALKNKEIIALIGIDNFKDVGVEFSDEMKAEIDGFVDLLKNNFSEVAPAYAEGTLFHPSTDSLIKARVIKDIKNSDSIIAISTLEALFKYALIEAKQLSMLKQKIYLINSNATPTNTDGLDATGIAYDVIEINATGHYPMIEKPELFNSLLKQTIQKIVVLHN